MAHIRVVCIFIFLILLVSLMVFPVSGVTNITHTDDGKILMSDGKTWVKIDPVSDHIVGDTFSFTGVTNLPPGSTIIGQIYIMTPPCLQKTCNVDLNSYGNTNSSVIRESFSGINSFSILINTSGIIPSDDYIFSIFPEKGDIGYGDNIVLFPKNFIIQNFLFPSSLSQSQKRYWIWINPLTNEPIYHENVGLVNSSFQLTGLTNLPAGDTIRYSIYPSSVIDEKFSEKNFVNRYVENYGIVTSGNSNGNNTFSITIDMSKNCPGTYYITLWNPRYNLSVPNDFLSTSTAFGFREGSNGSAVPNCSLVPARVHVSVTPLSTNYAVTTTPHPGTASSPTGILPALIGIGSTIILVRIRKQTDCS
jgi:hypothetical protein